MHAGTRVAALPSLGDGFESGHFDRWCRCAQPPANGCDPYWGRTLPLPHGHELMRVVQRPAKHRQPVLLDQLHRCSTLVGGRRSTEGELEREVDSPSVDRRPPTSVLQR